jgi:hypothetical protein
MFTTRRPPSRLDVCNYNTLLYRDYDTNINFTKNYLLSQSPPPMSYRNLRSVMSTVVPSSLVTLPDSIDLSQTSIKSSPKVKHRKRPSRRKHERKGVDVYRTLARTESRCSALGERDITNDEMMFLANSFIVDHVSPSPTSGFFHPKNLPNIQKHRTNNNNSTNRIGTSHIKSYYSSSPMLRTQHSGQNIRPTPVDIQYEDYNNNNRIGTSHKKSSYPSSPPSRIQHTEYIQPTPPELIHRTTPVDIQYEEDSHGSNRIEISQTQSSYPFSPSLRLQHVGHIRPTPSQPMHRTTPADIQYEDDNSRMTITTTTTMNSSSMPEIRTRKQLHVYMPQILSC